jgi:hypothetical protein
MYSLAWHYHGKSSQDLPKELELGELRRHYELYREQLPRLLPDEFLGGKDTAENVSLDKPVAGISLTKSDAMLFTLPSDQVVLAVVFGFTTADPLDRPACVRAIANVLEQSIKGQVTMAGVDLAQHVESTLPVGPVETTGWERDTLGDSPLHPERHQLVFITRHDESESVPSPEAIHDIVYRDTPPYREEFARLQEPEQLNLSANDTKVTLGIVTPYVSLLYGHERYVEDSIFLSTVHAVGTASTFRQIWHESYKQVREFRDQGQAKEPGAQTRAALEKLADNLGNLEFDLTFSVEFPLMRIETFHSALYEAMDLSSQATALSQMFSQLGGSLRSEITAIDVRERRRDDGRQRWNAFAAAVLSLIGVSVGFVIAFLGINTTQVPSGDKQLSMWDSRFATVYLVAGLFALVPVFLILFPYLRDWVNNVNKVDKPSEREDRRPLWTGLAALAAGGVLFAGAVFVDDSTGRDLVIDALLKSIGVLALLVGLSLTGLRLWKDRALLWRRAKRLFVRPAPGR